MTLRSLRSHEMSKDQKKGPHPIFLSDPGNPGVRSMGPRVSHSLTPRGFAGLTRPDIKNHFSLFKQELCCEENISFYSENMLGVLLWCVWCSNFEHYGILLQNVWMILLFIRLWKFKLSMTCRRPHILWAHFVKCWAGNISTIFNTFYWERFWHFYTFIFSGTHILWL